MDEIELTDEEKKAIRALRRVAKTWPDTLWVFCNGGELTILRTDARGERAHNNNGSINQDYIVGSAAIPNDGGDW